MSEIKSAFEKAMERAEKLGKESTEERERRVRETRTAQAEGLARRYLNISSYESKDLKKDVDRIDNEAREMVASAILESLLETVSPWADTERLFQGILVLGGNRDKIDELGRLCSDFRAKREQEHAALAEQLEQLKREELFPMGISGSSICADVDSSEDWQRAMQALETEFGKKKKELFS